MSLTETKPASGMTRKVVILGVVVGAGIAVWSAIWFAVARIAEDRIGVEIARLGARGLAIDCPGLGVSGYPFRLEVSCDRLEVRQGNALSVRFGRSRAVTLLYNPTLAILDVDGPGEMTGPDGSTLTATWTSLQASIGTTNWRPDRISVAADKLDLTATPPGRPATRFVTDHGELHGRLSPAAPGDLDLAALFRGATLTAGQQRILPERSDYAVEATLVRWPLRAGGPLPRLLRAWQADDGKLEVTSLRFGSGSIQLDGKGSFALEPDGRLTGTANLVGSGFEGLAAGAVLGRKPPAELAVLASGFLLFGKPVKDREPKGRSLDFTIEQGRMKLGKTGLGELPPLFRAEAGS
jgi:hypothetical protein